MIRVIDVSNNNGAIDWPAVAASGVEGAVIKASEGVGFTDAFFAQNWGGARACGLVCGAYHFGRPSLNGGAAEAAFFLETVRVGGGLRAGDFLALDLEDDGVGAVADLLVYALEFLVYSP